MAMTLQVLYPVGPDTTFDYDYYANKHFPIVQEAMGDFIASVHVVKGLAGGPGTAPEFHAIATMNFASKEALESALKASGPALADIPNFTNVQPQMLIGETLD
ncbi:EthD family reductase [Roseibium aggregatum]|uniref:EthD family reductase n=1 Tax=Roseibium aggregatum TaxID=187304 RepID=A0A926NRG8_9HYPH|nr:EthD family reductase [Roseibium aggregatum]MBD1545119.1 EthD family reductase [Roseibium aggregatum]